MNGPYAVLLGADAETSDHGYPVLEYVKRLVKDQIIWAPAIAGAFVVTTRGGDFELHIGQDVSIGYLNHNDAAVRLYRRTDGDRRRIGSRRQQSAGADSERN